MLKGEWIETHQKEYEELLFGKPCRQVHFIVDQYLYWYAGQHPTPPHHVRLRVVVVLTTGTLLKVESDDELLGFIAHEVGHEYFAQYSIYTKHLLQMINDTGREAALLRSLNRMLALIELQCDAFAAITLTYAGCDPIAFIECMERFAKKFPKHPIDFHPCEIVRRRVVAGVLQDRPIARKKGSPSPLLNEIKSDLRQGINSNLSSNVRHFVRMNIEFGVLI